VISPHTFWDRHREVVHDTPEGVIGRLQDDVDGVVHLGRLATDRLHLPGRLALGDEAALAVERPSEPSGVHQQGRQHDHSDPGARHRSAHPASQGTLIHSRF
jgi:hypothetical protein